MPASSPPAAESSPKGPHAAPVGGSRGSRRGLSLLFGIALLWWLMLAALAALTANPVTLNVEQIRRADYVVTAKISDQRAGVLVVEKEWKRGADFKQVAARNLALTSAKPGRRYLVPLSRTGADEYQVTPTELPDRTPLIYPATEEARSQLSAILAHEEDRK